jgi:prepilin-type N-terminal cleavage/methylation domain-containing protein
MSIKAQGYSLIELSVVLVMISLATAIVIPNLSSAYQSFQNRSQMDEMILRATSLSYKAYSSGKRIHIASVSDAIGLLRPSGEWRIEVVAPLSVTANGVCLGGEFLFAREDFSRRVRLVPPYCHTAAENSYEQ